MNFVSESSREALRTWLAELVSLPTFREDGTTDDDSFRDAVEDGFEWLTGWAEQRDFECRNWDDRVLEIRAGSGPEVGVATHLDVVPYNELDWSVDDPGELHVQGSEDPDYVGRGVIDDKGPIAAILLVMDQFYENDAFPVSLRLIVDSAEEVGLKNLRHYFEESDAPLPPRTLVADGFYPVVAGEKGLLRVNLLLEDFTGDASASVRLLEAEGGDAVNQVPGEARATLEVDDVDPDSVREEFLERGGSLSVDVEATLPEPDRVRLEVRGDTAHAAAPDEGRNAVSGLVALLGSSYSFDLGGTEPFGPLADELCEEDGTYRTDASGFGLADDDERFDRGTTSNLGTLTHRSDGTLKLGLDFRLVPSTAPSRAFERIREWSPGGLKGTLDVEHCSAEPALIVPLDEELPRSALAGYEAVRSGGNDPVYTGGRTHATALENAFAFGCMEPDRFEEYGFHGAGERVPEHELIETAKIYAETLRKFGDSRDETA